MPSLVIIVDCKYLGDAERIRSRAISAVEEAVEDEIEAGEFDGHVEVSWDIEEGQK
jgi:hypothetical protein